MKEYVNKFDILFQTVDKAPEPRQIYSTHLPHLIYKGRWQHEVLTVGF